MPSRWMIACFTLVSVSVVRADDPKPADVEFHSAAYAFPASEKTPERFAQVNPDRKIIEVTIRLSADFNIPDEEVDRIEYRLKMPEDFEICDYLPKTTLGSEFAKEIQVEEGAARRSVTVVAIDAGAKVGFQMPAIGGEARVGGSKNDQQSRDNTSNVRMDLLPPKQLVTSASTRDYGRSLHFRMKRFNQITLAGDKDFAFLASVPKDWKGDGFTLESVAIRKGENDPSTKTTRLIGLYMTGDAAAKARVEAMVKAKRPAVASNPSTPRPAPAPTPAPEPVNPAFAKYAGKYSIRAVSGLTGYTDLHLELKPDGAYDGTLISSAMGELGTQSGVWRVDDETLVITRKRATMTTLFGTATKELDTVWLNSKIKSFDSQTRRLVTETHELKPR